MAELEIVKYPHPALLKPASSVKKIDKEIEELANNMIETMLKAPGLGLAAPQVGVSKRLFVVNGELFNKPNTGVAFINPVIKSKEGESVIEEGCLSVPEETGEVHRAEKLTVEAQSLDGKTFSIECEGLLARVIQHEMDHLDGILFYERIRGFKKEMISKRLKKRARRKTA